MNELDPEEMALLRAHRARESLTPAHRERLWRGVQAQVEARRGVSGPWRAVALLVAALALLVIGVEWSRHRARRAEQEQVRDEALYGAAPSVGGSVAPTSAPRVARAREQAPSAVARPTEEVETLPLPADAVEGEPQPRPSRTPTPALDERESPDPEAATETPAVQRPRATLEQESELLHQARVALSRDRIDRALALLEDHRRRFGAGIFEPEREALTAIARCRQSGEPSALRTFSARFPDSPLLERVRTGCGEPEGPPSVDSP